MKKLLYRIIKRGYDLLIQVLSLQELEDDVVKVPAIDPLQRTSCEQQKIESSPDKGDNGSHPVDAASSDDDALVNKQDFRREIECQDVFHGVDKKFVDRIYHEGSVQNIPAGTVIAKQGDSGSDLFFILSGEISIFINEQLVDISYRHECVGEMVLFDATRRRSATLKAHTDSILFVVKSKVVKTEIMAEMTRGALIYNIAQMIAERLRKRERLLRAPNDIPLVFIGSSLEAKCIAQKVEKRLKKQSVIQTEMWTAEDMFSPSKSVMEDLERWISKCDFAILILSKDDWLKSRTVAYDSPRDNVIFELGYCMGKIGRDRTLYLLQDAKVPRPTKVPSDVYGLTYLPYTDGNSAEISTAVRKILMTINPLGVRK